MDERKDVSYETINYDVADKIATITLNRPDRLNAFTAQMMVDLIDAFGKADDDDDVRAVIVTGAGRGFCAGADLQAGAGTFDNRVRGGADNTATAADSSRCASTT
jgi:enoyl-CoA hydratase/carnithine racemase